MTECYSLLAVSIYMLHILAAADMNFCWHAFKVLIHRLHLHINIDSWLLLISELYVNFTFSSSAKQFL